MTSAVRSIAVFGACLALGCGSASEKPVSSLGPNDSNGEHPSTGTRDASPASPGRDGGVTRNDASSSNCALSICENFDDRTSPTGGSVAWKHTAANGGIAMLVPSTWSAPNALWMGSSVGKNTDVASLLGTTVPVKSERAHLEFKVALNLGGALLPAAAAITIVAISAGESDFIALVRTPTGSGIYVSSTGTLFDIQDTLDNKAIAIVLDVAYGSAGSVRMKIDNTEVVNETDVQTSLSAPSSVEVQLGVAFRGVIGLSTNQVFAKFDDVLAN